MKTLKVILGIVIVLAIGSEYAHASIDLKTFFDPIILFMVFGLTFFSAWLIGDGASKSQIKIKSVRFIGFYLATIGLFLLALFVALLKSTPSS